ncbi:MAG: hypothetical protein ACOYM8_07625 [Caulobacterales bacterium]|jgi:hypothetical protein
MPQSPWEDAVVRAAAEASRLQPLAWFLAFAAALWSALAGLGLVLALISRVVRNVVAVAAALKAENEQIV